MNELREHLDALKFSTRAWLIIERRWGPGSRATLAGLGSQLELSRERIRQIENRAVHRFVFNVRLRSLFKATEQALGASPPGTGCSWDHDLRQALSEAGYEPPEDGGLFRLASLVRAAAKLFGGAWSWPQLAYLACRVEPIVPIESIRREQKERQKAKRLARKELTNRGVCIAVLREEGRPLHWHEIVSRAEKKARRELSASGVYNCLSGSHDTFVRTGQGTYGLLEWGLEPVPRLIDAIVDALNGIGRPASAAQVRAAIGRLADRKLVSINLYLQLHGRFYQCVSGEFGLRAWLPPAEEQTLRTPPAFVESPQSRRRLDRFADRGYNLERILAVDRGEPAG